MFMWPLPANGYSMQCLFVVKRLIRLVGTGYDQTVCLSMVVLLALLGSVYTRTIKKIWI